MTAVALKRATVCLAFLLVAQVAAASDLTPSPRLPETLPWDLESLRAVPEVEWLDMEGAVRSMFYAGEPYRGKPTRVFAYYATPGTLAGDVSTDKELPAVVLVHGGGGTAFREWCQIWAERGYAAIAMDLAGHRPIEGLDPHEPENRLRLPFGGPDQGGTEKFASIDQPVTEQWSYHAVAAVLRAHSLIRSFPEVDAERTAVTGISWGGYLTCIVAGIDNRFRAAVPVYGCGFLDENSAWLEEFAKMSPPQNKRWVKLWDPSRYLPAVSMPILFLNGTNDFAYPLDSYMRSFDIVPGAKQLGVTVNMPHSHPDGWAPKQIALFIDHHLRGATGLPEVGEPKLEDGEVQMPYKSPTKLAEAALHFTTGNEEINKRTWQSVPASIEEGAIKVGAPPAGTTTWFLTVSDERGGTISSRVVFAAP